MNLQKRTPYRNKAILKSAEEEECTMESPWCNHDPETVVFCHLNYQLAGKGIGQKADDYAGFYGCSDCHTWYDEHIDSQIVETFSFYAVLRTWRRLLDKGVLK